MDCDGLCERVRGQAVELSLEPKDARDRSVLILSSLFVFMNLDTRDRCSVKLMSELGVSYHQYSKKWFGKDVVRYLTHPL